MNINILLAVENHITRIGLSSIITEGLLACNIKNVPKQEIINKINTSSFDIIVYDLSINSNDDFFVISQIKDIDPKAKLFVLTSKQYANSRFINFFKNNNIGLIFNNYSDKIIIKHLNADLIAKSTISSRIRKKVNSQDITFLLSNRELEIALLLVKGETLTTISESKNLAMTTISTYKKRIFEKTKVKNLIELAQLFQKIQLKN